MTVTLYRSGLIAFGSTFPSFSLWTLVMIGAFLHSLMTEEDPFLKKQITMSLLAPLMAGSLFVLLYLLPGVEGRAGLEFTTFALFSVILPFALPSALDNLSLYQARLAAESKAYRERERIARELHDTLGNDLTTIRFVSQGARHLLSQEPAQVGTLLGEIEEIASRWWGRCRRGRKPSGRSP